MFRTSNRLIENASSVEDSSAGGTSAEGTSIEMQRNESIKTHISKNKI